MKKLIFLELNEINFELVKKYCEKYDLKNLKTICTQYFITRSEKEYELLEPWIQWFSVHTGLRANEHKVFRLGDAEKSKIPQYFEEIEGMGYKVGIISSMNSVNNLKNPSYFIPDPWTRTKTDGTFVSNLLDTILKSVVNNNANNKVGLKNYLYLILLFFKFARFKNYILYFKYFLTSFKKKWRKSLFLDLFLNDIHMLLFKSKKTNFSTLFLNAGAHIQHHYLFNSLGNEGLILNPENILKKKSDPFKEALFLYEKILNDYLNNGSFNIIIATGLTQTLTKNIDYYYRLRNHEFFLKKLNINFKNILPRMSRDFLIEFDFEKQVENCYNILSNVYLNQDRFFGVLEKRKNSLFVTLTYNKEIYKSDMIRYDNICLNIFDLVAFVSIKNGMHCEKGFLFIDNDIKKLANLNSETIDLIHINTIVKKFFLKDVIKNKYL